MDFADFYSGKGRRHNPLSCYDRLPDTDYAYVTLLTRPGYLQGVQVLARSLRLVGASHPLIVLHTNGSLPSSALAALRCEGCYLHDVEPYAPPSKGGEYALSHYSDCWNKMHLWRLERYKRLVYLDADMMLLQNPDDLFMEHPPAGTSCGHARCTSNSFYAATTTSLDSLFGPANQNSLGCGRSSSACNTSDNTCCSDLWSVCDCYHARGDATERARCPFLWPHQQHNAASSAACCRQDCGAARKLGVDSYFNAGLLVLTPSCADLDAMEAALATPEGAASIGQYAEQDFLNWFWQRAWRWRRLSWHYNAQWHSIGPHADMWQSAAADITVVHFNDKLKPWHKAAHERRAHPLEARWADILETVPPCHAPGEADTMAAPAQPFSAWQHGARGNAAVGGPPSCHPGSAHGAGLMSGLERAGNSAALVE